MTPTTTKRKLPRQQETNNKKQQVVVHYNANCTRHRARKAKMCVRHCTVQENSDYHRGRQVLSHCATEHWFTGGISLSHAQNMVYRGRFSLTCTKYWFTGGISLSCAQNMVYRGRFSPIVYRTLVYRGQFSPIVHRTLVYKGR